MTTQGYVIYGTDHEVRDEFGNVLGALEIEIYDSYIGGAQVVDLLDINDQPIDLRPKTFDSTTAPTPVDVGRAIFQAPQSYSVLYGQLPPDPTTHISPPRFRLLPQDIGTRIDQAISKSDAASKAVQGLDTATAEMNAVSARMDTLEAEQDNLAASSVNLDELVQSQRIPGVWVSGTWTQRIPAGVNYSLWIAPMPCSVVSFDLVFDTAAKSGGGSDQWNFSLMRIDAVDQSSHLIVSKATVSGQPIVAMADWSFAGASWSTSYQKLAAGDVLALQYSKVGAPTFDPPLPATAVWRYVPA